MMKFINNLRQNDYLLEDISMQEKFLNLSKGIRFLIVVLLWLITIVAFVGCLLIKHYYSIYWLEILLTCVGMLFCSSCYLHDYFTSYC